MDTLCSLQLNSSDKLFDIEESAYEKRQKIGSGTYGIVYTAADRRTGQMVAVKKVCNVFDNLIIARRTYREIKILRHFRHENIIHIRDILQPRDKLFSDVYLVFDLMDTDLHQVIHSKQELTDLHVRYFLYQILRGLKYIHSANVIHRDMKPSNLLVNENCDLKIGDFGMARAVSCTGAADSRGNELLMTQYVMTRWYRAPEVMLFRRPYTVDVDMWSVGCILAEMLARRALFPGTSLNHQLTLIVNTLGAPDEDFVSLAHADRIKDFLLKLKPTETMSLTTLLPGAHPKSIRLLQQMLRWHPSQRLSVESALRDLYVNHYHDPNDEPVCSEQLDFKFDEDKMDDIAVLRRVISDEIDKSLSGTSMVSSASVSQAITSHHLQSMPAACAVQPSLVQPELTTDSIQCTVDQKSSTVVSSVATFAPSLPPSSCHKVVRRRGKTSRQSTRVNAGRVSIGRPRTVSRHSPVAVAASCRLILPATSSSGMSTSAQHTRPTVSTVDAKAILRAAILSGSRQMNVRQRGGRRGNKRQQHASSTNGSRSLVTPLTDEDKNLLERWQQMQQHVSSADTSVPVSSANSMLSMVSTSASTSSATGTTEASDCGAVQLSSADCRLADRCLQAGTQLIWSPSVSLSSSDIAGCLHTAGDPTQATTRPTVVIATMADPDDRSPETTVGQQQRSSAGYGTGELIPLVDSNGEPMILATDDIDLSELLSEDM